MIRMTERVNAHNSDAARNVDNCGEGLGRVPLAPRVLCKDIARHGAARIH